MKTMIKKWLLPVIALMPLFASCEKDTDSNPTLRFQEGQTFKLVTPTYDTNRIIDLKGGQPVALFCNQPDYGGIPMSVIYHVQVSLDEKFMTTTEGVEFRELQNTASETTINVNANELNDTIISLYVLTNNIKTEEFPKNTPMPAYFRLRAELTNGTGVCFSNPVKVENILAEYVAPELKAPQDELVFTGSLFGDNWSTWYKMSPMVQHTTDAVSEFKAVVYNPGNGLFKFGRAEGEYIGFDALKEVVGSSKGEVSGVDDGFGGKNIQIAAEGWYTLHFTVKVAGTELEYTLDLNPAHVYIIGDPAGDWTPGDPSHEMTPNADGIFVSPAFAAGGELRAYVAVDGVDWWQSEFTYNKNTQEITWRTDKQNIQFNWTDLGDEYSISCAAGQKLYVDFKNGTAEVK